MTLLAASGLGKSFGGVQAVKNISFSIGPGEMLALIGPNGAGKSTTFNMVGGQLRPDAGELTLDGEDVLGLPPRQMFRKGVGRTFQVAQTFATMSVRENVRLAITSREGRTRRLAPLDRDLYLDEVEALLDLVGMKAFIDETCATLSYGDVKRVELAIALAGRPKLLLMDEPTAGMAPRERAALMSLTAKIARDGGIGVLFTEHDMDAVFTHADRIIVLVRGESVAQGTPEEVRADPLVRRVYLGEAGAPPAHH